MITTIGQKFGRWTVISDSFRENGIRVVPCICDCGNKKNVYIFNLIKGKTKSCGCYANELTSKYFTKHGETKNRNKYSDEYRCWCLIKRRCYNPNDVSYDRYGARGIKMCDGWMKSYASFLEDVGRKPTKKHSIDRIDSSKNYSCGHCDECIQNEWTANLKWSTIKEQNRNKRGLRFIEHLGETKTIAEWAEIYQTSYTKFRDRLVRLSDSNMDVLIFKFYPQFLWTKTTQ